ncbi:MAG: hypothetical protein E4G99_08220 [Anaerolineales bacterium]|nr:MAG: hypothetical protein E4G99_08220 [Anaerolineales bacterium]
MLNRKALMLSVGITAFVIVTIGGVFAAFAQSRLGSGPAIAAADLLSDPAVQAALSEREAAYQQLIDEANQRLAEATTATTVMTEPVLEEYPVSIGLAVALAQNALGGGTLLRQPEMVLLNGRVAYELILDRGQVYIDATSGAILYNSGAAALVANASGSSRGHDDDDDHEGFDD